MQTMLSSVNWLAVLAGTAAAFVLGMFWFGQIFGRVWAAGSHNITPPASLPLAAMAAQLLGTFMMALAIGATESVQDLPTALVVILAIAALQLGGALFSQKSTAAALIDGGFVLAMGVVMIGAQALL
jgi:hypothetical protein